jgi:transposase
MGSRSRARRRGVPDPELIERPRGRRFTAEYKLAILREADACAKPVEIGVLLRREGLHSSLLTEWRGARDSGALQTLERPRGRSKADPRDAQWRRCAAALSALRPSLRPPSG